MKKSLLFLLCGMTYCLLSLSMHTPSYATVVEYKNDGDTGIEVTEITAETIEVNKKKSNHAYTATTEYKNSEDPGLAVTGQKTKTGGIANTSDRTYKTVTEHKNSGHTGIEGDIKKKKSTTGAAGNVLSATAKYMSQNTSSTASGNRGGKNFSALKTMLKNADKEDMNSHFISKQLTSSDEGLGESVMGMSEKEKAARKKELAKLAKTDSRAQTYMKELDKKEKKAGAYKALNEENREIQQKLKTADADDKKVRTDGRFVEVDKKTQTYMKELDKKEKAAESYRALNEKERDIQKSLKTADAQDRKVRTNDRLAEVDRKAQDFMNYLDIDEGEATTSDSLIATDTEAQDRLLWADIEAYAEKKNDEMKMEDRQTQEDLKTVDFLMQQESRGQELVQTDRNVQTALMLLDTEVRLMAWAGYHYWFIDYGLGREYALTPWEFGHISYHSAMGDTLGEYSKAEGIYNAVHTGITAGVSIVNSVGNLTGAF